jgi:hypothetical protein
MHGCPHPEEGCGFDLVWTQHAIFGQQILTLEDNTASPLLEWRELLSSFSKSEFAQAVEGDGGLADLGIEHIKQRGGALHLC